MLHENLFETQLIVSRLALRICKLSINRGSATVKFTSSYYRSL